MSYLKVSIDEAILAEDPMQKDDARPGLAMDVIELANHGDGLTTDIVGFFDKSAATRAANEVTHIRPSKPFGQAYAEAAPTEIDDLD